MPTGRPGRRGRAGRCFLPSVSLLRKRRSLLNAAVTRGAQLSLVCPTGPLPPSAGNPCADSRLQGPGPTFPKLHTNGLFSRNKSVSRGPRAGAAGTTGRRREAAPHWERRLQADGPCPAVSGSRSSRGAQKPSDPGGKQKAGSGEGGGGFGSCSPICMEGRAGPCSGATTPFPAPVLLPRGTAKIQALMVRCGGDLGGRRAALNRTPLPRCA